MQSVSDNTAINYDKSLKKNPISVASHLTETSKLFYTIFNALLYLQGGCCTISTPMAEPLAVSSVGWCFSRAVLMHIFSSNIV